jgi:hypothetical protein
MKTIKYMCCALAFVLAAPAEAASLFEQIGPVPNEYALLTDYNTPGQDIDGTYIFGPSTVDVTGTIYRLGGGTGAYGLSTGCSAGDFTSGVRGNIVLVSRGDCEFIQKTRYAQDAGALGVLIAENDPRNIVAGGLGGNDLSLTITAFRLSLNLGKVLADQTLTKTTTVRLALGDNLVPHVTSPVPEPGTWLTMLTGFALVGGFLRRRGDRTMRAV